jgi:hypothetical protein
MKITPSTFIDTRISKQTGNETIYYCPFCISIKGTEDTKGKLYVNYQKGAYKCYRCGTQGYFHGKARFTIKKKQNEISKQIADTPKSVSEIPQNLTSKLNKKQLAYLEKRIGKYFPIKKYIDIYNILANNNLIFFPIRNKYGNIVSYTQINPKTNMKLNSKGSRYLYGEYELNKDLPYVIVCEGVIDALSYGLGNAVAVQGKPSREQLETLKSYNKEIVIALDRDAIPEIIYKEDSIWRELTASLILYPYGDPNEFTTKELNSFLENRIQYTSLNEVKVKAELLCMNSLRSAYK